MYQKKRGGKVFLILFILFLLAGGAGAYYYFFVMGADSNKTTEVVVTLDANGGTFGDELYGFTLEDGVYKKTLTVGYAYGNLPKLTKSGYVFVGWSLNGAEPCVQPAEEVAEQYDFTLTAVWEEETIYTYKIYYAIYDVDTGNINATLLRSPVSGSAINRTVVIPEELKFDGYTLFKGTTNTGATSNLSCELVRDGMNLFMYYVANTYSIKYTYSAVGATYSKTTQFKYAVNRVSLVGLRSISNIQSEDARFIVNGKSFAYWEVNGKRFNDGAYVSRYDLAQMGFSLDLTNGGVTEVALNAVYEESTYKVTYMSQGAVYDTADVKFQSLLTAPTSPNPTGYTFVGWYNADTGATGTQISGLTKINFNTYLMPSQNCTLYAGFTLISYNLNLDIGADGYYAGARNPIIGNIESDFTLVYPDTHQRGYTFAGWIGEGLTEPTMDVHIGAMTSELNYTATYKEKVYFITYNLSGGELSDGASNPSEYKVSTADITLNNPSKRGYDFKGWQLDGETDASTSVTIATGSIGDRTYTAKFTPTIYNITYDLIYSEAEFKLIQKDTFTIEDEPYIVDEPICAGYDFVEWQLNGAQLPNNLLTFANRAENITLTAVWTYHNYSITYNLNGGTCSNPTAFTIATPTFTLNNPTKTAYNFVGWTGSNGTTPQTTVEIATGAYKEDLSFEAHYAPVNYSITYNNIENATFNGGEANVNPTTYNVETETFTLTNPEKSGYNFAGWEYTYDGTTKTEKFVEIAKGRFMGNLAFTAVFTLKEYTVTLSLKSGKLPSGYSTKITYTVETPDFDLPEPTRAGYTFTGWTNEETLATAIVVTIDTSVAKDLKYVANWNITSYNIIYELNGGYFSEGTTPPESYRVIDDDITPSTPYRDGYNFAGWTLYEYVEDTDSWSELEDITTIYCKDSTGDRKFVASWRARTDTLYTVEHRVQPINGDTNLANYTLQSQNTYRTKTDSEVTQSAVAIEGFTAQTESMTLTINGDGSTKFVFYYSRNTQNVRVTWDADSADGEGIAGVDISNEYGAQGNGDYYYGQKVTVVVTVKTGYTYKGLFSNGNNVSTKLEYSFTIGLTDVALVAKAQINTYTITYSVESGALFNGSTTNPNPTQYTVKDNFTLVNPEVEGTNFLGWSGTGIKDKAETVTISAETGERAYTANFGDKEYTITYELDGGIKSADGNYPEVYTRKSADITPSALQKLGYTFTGWTLYDASGAVISSGKIASGSTGNYKFVAGFTANTDTPYTVKHYYMDVNGQYNRSTPSETENLTGTTDTTVTPQPKIMTGYITPTAQTKTVTGNGLMVIEYEYARMTYGVSIAIVGTGIEGVSDTSLKYYWGTTVSVEAVVKKGYTFNGWVQTSGGSVLMDATTAKVTFVMPTADVAFSVSAQMVTYTITYELSGGTLPDGASNPTSYTVEDAPFTLVNPTLDGYDFLGWESQGLSSPSMSVTVVPSNECKDLSFVAKFDPAEVKYTIKYYQMTVDGTGYTLFETDDTKKATTGTTIQVKGHDIEGFITPSEQSLFIKADGSAVVEIKYERKKYSVLINQNETNSGVNTLSGAGEYYYFSDVTVSVTLKDYYTFTGWSRNGVVVSTDLTYSFKMEKPENYVLTAVTKGQIYSIAYDLNNDNTVDNKNNPTEYEYGVELQIADPTCSGYVFLGWTIEGYVDNLARVNITFSADCSGGTTLKAFWGKEYTDLNYAIKEDDEGNAYASAGKRYFGTFSSTSIEVPKYIRTNGTSITFNAYGVTVHQAYVVDEEYYTNGNANTYIVKEISGQLIAGSNLLSFENTNLSSITLPDSIEKIGLYAFFGTKITSITLPNSVKTIEKYVFALSTLTSLTLPNSVESLGEGAFYKCNSLQTVTTGSGFTMIGMGAFQSCINLSSVDFTNSNVIETIGDSVFYECTSLTSVALPNTLTTLGRSMFHACYNLQTINMPTGLITIGQNAFIECNKITSLDLSHLTELTTIEKNVFYKCGGLTSIKLPESLTSLGNMSFGYCPNLKTVDLSATQLTELGEDMFYNAFALENVLLPSTLQTIREKAFYLCESLQTISIPNSVTQIKKFAFSFCERLRETGITGSSQLTHIGSYAFQNCRSLLKFTLPSTIKTVDTDGGKVFHECTKLYQLTNLPNFSETDLKKYFLDDANIDDGTTAISTNSTFSNGVLNYNTTKKIATLTSSSGVVTLVDYYGTDTVLDLSGMTFTATGICPFYKIFTLQEVIMPSTWCDSGSSTFYYCSNLMKCTILNSSSDFHIAGLMFNGCNKLVQLQTNHSGIKEKVSLLGCFANKGFEVVNVGGSFSNTITKSGDIITYTIASGSDAGTYFMGYTGTSTTLDLSSYTKLFAGGLAGCKALTSVTLASTVTEIPANFFDHCWGLTGVTLPETVTTIGNNAFYDCLRLQTVDISNASSIGEYAFALCLNINDIVISDSVTEIQQFTFMHCNSLAKCKLSVNIATIGKGAFQVCPLNYEENGEYYFVVPETATVESDAFNSSSRTDLIEKYGSA